MNIKGDTEDITYCITGLDGEWIDVLYGLKSIAHLKSADFERIATILRCRRERDELDARIEKEAKGEGSKPPF